MNSRSKPYFFAFETKAKPGKIIAHCVRVETIELDADHFDQTQFTLFPADFENDLRLRQLCRSAYSFIKGNNIDPNSQSWR